MPYGEENDPILNIIAGAILIILGLFYFLNPPPPGEEMGGKLGALRAPPVIITRIFSAGTIGFGVWLIRKSITINKE